MTSDPVPCIAPFVLARVAGLPLQPLIDMAPPRTTALIDDVLIARAEADALRLRLERALHGAVPALRPPVRAATLQLKRAVHNSRICEIPSELLGQIASAFDRF